MDWPTCFQCIVNGILISGLYAIVTLGLSLVLGVMGIVNFAHGEFVMLGAYVTYWSFTLYGVDPFISLIFSTLILFAIGTVVFKFTIKPILNAPAFDQLLITFGISIILQNIALILWKADYRSILTPYSDKSLSLGILNIGFMRTITFIIAMAVAVIMSVVFAKTNMGKCLRAVSQNRKAAILVGINTDRAFMLAFGMAAAIGGIAGTLVETTMYTFPLIGGRLGLKAFCVLILGGLGNIYGTIFASLILGISESIIGTYAYQGSGWAEGISFALIILVLLIKPTGLAGLRRE